MFPPVNYQREIRDLLKQVLAELQAIRQATETEAVEDADDPFQTLNGPRTTP